MNPQDANIQFVRDNIELIPIAKAEGRIAAEGALPYPPGVLCVVPGEMWGGAVQRYFLALEEGSIYCRASHRNCRVFISKKEMWSGGVFLVMSLLSNLKTDRQPMRMSAVILYFIPLRIISNRNNVPIKQYLKAIVICL